MQLTRKKRRNIKLSLAYKLVKLIPLNSLKKLKLLLDLSWIFSRLAHEQIFRSDVKIDVNEEDDIIRSFITSNSNVLDIGCGTGHVIDRLIGKTENIVGIDYNKDSISVAKKRFSNKNIILICDDVFNYLKNNPAKKFEYIILSHVLEHIDNPEAFLKQLNGVARYLYIEVPDFEASHLNLYRKRVDTDLIYSDADHVSEFDRNELEKIISQCDYFIVRSEFRFGVIKYWCEYKFDLHVL